MPVAPLSEWILLAVLTTALCGVVFFKFRKLLIFNSPKTSSLVLLAKIGAGIGLLLIYSGYHTDRATADVFKYFDDAKCIYESTQNDRKSYLLLTTGLISDEKVNSDYLKGTRNWLKKDESWISFSKTRDFNFFQSNRFITRIHMALWPITKGKILLHVLFFALISFAGAVFLLRILENNIEHQFKSVALIILFLLPTTLLWCSGMLKDTLVLFALQLLLYNWFLKTGFYSNCAILFSILLIGLVKYYLLPPLIFILFVHILTKKGLSSIQAFFLTGFVSLTFILAGVLIGSPFDVLQLISDKRQEALKIAVMGDAKEYVFYNFSSAKSLSSIYDYIKAIANGLFYPFWPSSISNKLGILFWIENVILWISSFILVYYRIKKNQKTLPSMTLVVLFSVFSGLIIAYTTPVSGGLLRYKSAYWSLLFAFIWFAWKNKKINPLQLNASNSKPA